MKASLPTLLAAAALVVLNGCNQGTSGGPGTTTTERPAIGVADDTFTLGVPTLAVSLKQGEAKAISIDINRGANFQENVALKFNELPKGVTIDPSSPTIKHGDKEAKVTVKAADDAALGEFKVRLVGHPTKGTDASNQLTIKVDKK